MNKKQLQLIGHAAIIMLISLLAGFGLVMELIGGFEVFPTHIIPFDLPGDSGAWVRAHSGGLMNALLIFVVAILIHLMKMPTKPAGQLHWMLIGTGYANTIFYWGGLFAGSHRALSFGDNRLGETSIAGIIGILPAFIFAFVMLYASIIIAKEAFRMAKDV
jgi:hypothetical protein